MSFDLWTLGLQAVNVVVLVWLLGRFFWRPVAKMIEDRRQTIDAALSTAEAKQQAAEKSLADIATTRAGFEAERQSILAAARAQGEEEHKAIRTQAEQEARALLDAAREDLAKERRQAETEWGAHAAQLAVDIARKLLVPLDNAAVRTAFADRLIETVARLPDPERRALGNSGAQIEAAAATPIPEAEQDRLRQRLGDALKVQPNLTFTTDPSLIAGIDLIGPHLVVHNSWRADLDRVLADLSDARR